MVNKYYPVIWIVLFGILVPSILFGLDMPKHGARELGVLESIYGIPFPVQGDKTVINEEMAHTDLFLQESVFAKRANITVSFDPEQLTVIDLGVRDNSFWLSYIKYPLYQKGIDPIGPQTKTLTIPLTAAIQDTNRSIDLMFFAEPTASPRWSIQSFHATVEPIMPTTAEVKNFIHGIIGRERPI